MLLRTIFAFGVAFLSACAAAPPSDGAAPSASATATALTQHRPRAFDAEKDPVKIHVIDTPGQLTDSTAPPPLPGQKPATNPFLTASCFGDPLGCSKAGDILSQSTSTDDFLARLTKAGFTVTPAP
jgi:hypothetical protein